MPGEVISILNQRLKSSLKKLNNENLNLFFGKEDFLNSLINKKKVRILVKKNIQTASINEEKQNVESFILPLKEVWYPIGVEFKIFASENKPKVYDIYVNVELTV